MKQENIKAMGYEYCSSDLSTNLLAHHGVYVEVFRNSVRSHICSIANASGLHELICHLGEGLLHVGVVHELLGHVHEGWIIEDLGEVHATQVGKTSGHWWHAWWS